MVFVSEEEGTYFEELKQLREDLHGQNGVFREASLFLAVKHNRVDIVRFLLVVSNHVNVNITDGAKNTPLIIAAGEGHCKMAAFLLDEGCEVGARNIYSQNALDRATTFGQLDMAQLLIDRGAADINAIGRIGTSIGRTLFNLHAMYIMSGRAKVYEKMFHVLVSNNSKILSVFLCDNNRYTLLHYLTAFDYPVEFVQSILDHLESPEAIMATLMNSDQDGCIPFHYANTPVMASLLIKSVMNTTRGKSFPPSACRDMIVARNDEKRSLLDTLRETYVDVDGEATRREEGILYMEAYTEQSVVVPLMVAEGPMKIPLNPHYNDFQRSIAKRFLKAVIGVPKWLVPSNDEHGGGVVFEGQLPRDILYVILSFLSLSDIMVM